jgi:hypothetical protein
MAIPYTIVVSMGVGVSRLGVTCYSGDWLSRGATKDLSKRDQAASLLSSERHLSTVATLINLSSCVSTQFDLLYVNGNYQVYGTKTITGKLNSQHILKLVDITVNDNCTFTDKSATRQGVRSENEGSFAQSRFNFLLSLIKNVAMHLHFHLHFK